MPRINLKHLMAIASALIVILLPGTFHADQGTTVPTGVSLVSIEVAFKLDPRITRGMYMGDRWVSPPTYTRVQQKDQKLVVYAQAMGRDAQRRPVGIDPTWKADNTDVVQVSPPKGREVHLIVLKEGQSDLTVRHGRVSKKLIVKAVQNEGLLRVDISR